MKTSFQDLVLTVKSKLLEQPPLEITFDREPQAKCAQSNLAKLREISESGANLYALWLRGPETDEWLPVYVGQRTTGKLLERLKQHLFHTPAGTQSKLKHVEAARKKQLAVGVTVAKVEPDPLRLSVEDQVIFLCTPDSKSLPWNRKSRQCGR